MVAATTKPLLVKLVKLAISRGNKEPFSIGSVSYQATRYVVKVEIGGVAGILAPLVGKKPVDTSVWVLEGDAPAFVKSEGPLYFGGPGLADPAYEAGLAGVLRPGHQALRSLVR
jgi:hypothetical protein